MRDFIYSLLTDYTVLIVFLHVISAVVWVGSLIALLVLSRKANNNTSLERRLSGRAALFKKLFKFLAPFVVLLFITSLIMALGYKDSAYDEDGFILDINGFEIYKYINTKGTIWLVMAMNMLFTLWIISKAECKLCKTQRATDCMWLINTYLLPINILLGVTAIYLGVVIRHTL